VTKPCFVVTLGLPITSFQQSCLFHLSFDPLLHMIGVKLCRSGYRIGVLNCANLVMIGLQAKPNRNEGRICSFAFPIMFFSP
jgi:hypothetical protein